MSEPFIGEIRLFPLTYPPQGWFACMGQLCPISEYQILYAVIGTAFGGNGTTTFKLPDLRGYAVVGEGTSQTGGIYYHGEPTGTGAVTLSAVDTPSHTHSLNAEIPAASTASNFLSTPGSTAALTRAIQAGTNKPTRLYAPTPTANAHLHGATIAPVGPTAVAPHSNYQPFLLLQHCIAWDGTYPSQN